MKQSFEGFVRDSGHVGVRNYVAVLPAVQGANELAYMMAREVDGVIDLRHNFGARFVGTDRERSIRSVVGLGANPNLYAVLVVGISCEVVSVEEIASRINDLGGNAYSIKITKEKCYEQVLEEGIEILRKLAAEASMMKRHTCSVSQLTVAVRCGGSGAISAISSNAAVDILIDNDATVIFSETAELIGAEKELAKRAISPTVSQKLLEVFNRMESKIQSYGVDILGSEPSKFNIDQGLTTIEEKSIGAIVKSGSRPLVDVLEYAYLPTSGAGLYFMDGSAQSPMLFAGMIAAGAHMILFSYVGGFAARCRNLTTFPTNIKSFPAIKVLGSCDDDIAKPYFDVYAGDIIRGIDSVEQIGKRIYDKVLSIASGELTYSDRNISYSEMFQLYSDGLLM